VYGKFAEVLGRVLLMGLALLPGMVIVLTLARVPWEMGLGCMAVIVGSALWCGTMGLLQAILFGAGRSAGLTWFGILAPYFLIVTLLNSALRGGHFLLLAMLPHRALSVVLNGGMPGIGPGGFSLLSFGVLTGLSLIGLALAPRLFRRAFERHIGAEGPTRWFPTFKRRLHGHRPKLGAAENPFYWQEKGPATRLLRWAVPIVYLICLPFLLMSRRLWDGEINAGILTVVGLIVLFAASAFYGASVFARDKKWGRAQALLLTGKKPAFFLGAKIRATYRALWFSLVLVGATCVWTLINMTGNEETQYSLGLIMCEALLLGPAAGVIIGMVFSLAASSTTLAILGLVSSVFWAIAGYGVLVTIVFAFSRGNPQFLTLTLILAVLAVVLGATRSRRNVWILGLVLATCFWTFFFGMLASARNLLFGNMFPVTLVGSAITWIIVVFWCWLAFRNLEAGMMEGSKS
jgi:hypothetical protein